MPRTGAGVQLLRRIMFWMVPAVLVAALAWSLLPRGGAQPTRPSRPPVVTTGPRPADTPRGQAPSAGQGEQTAPASLGPTGEIRAGTLVDTDAAGRKRWQITADTVSLTRGGQTVRLRRVHAVFYDPDGSAMTVSGAQGTYDTRSKDVELTGDVHGVGTNGREIFADRLSYSPASERVTGTGNVRVVEERVIMYADRMVSNTHLGETQFFGHVHMTVR